MANTAAKAPQNNGLLGAFDLIKPSWQAVKLNAVTFIELIIIPIMLNLLGAIFTQSSSGGIGLFFRVIGEMSSIILAPALIITQLESAKGKTIDFTPAVQQGLKFFWRYLGLAVCMAVIIGVGFLLLIVPGFFMLRRYILAPYFLIDQNLSIMDALKTSAERSKEFSSAVWGLLGVTLLFAVLCLILVGIVLSIMYYCAPAIRYYQIKQTSKKA